MQGRAYEDGAERVALRALLPPRGRRLLEIGAGFGRLVDLYAGYDEVVLLDYAHSQLLQARELLGDAAPGGRPRYRYVQANLYRLPFVPALYDTVVMVRTLHHAADGARVLHNISQVLAPSGSLVLEFANKRNLKAIIRYLLRRQSWSPFDPRPVEFVELNFDFHPAWVRRHLTDAGLRIVSTRTVSHFRFPLLKRMLPAGLLVSLDRLMQPSGALWQLTPSVFVRAVAAADKTTAADDAFFRCPACGADGLAEQDDHLLCNVCGARYPIRDGIYNLRPEEK